MFETYPIHQSDNINNIQNNNDYYSISRSNKRQRIRRRRTQQQHHQQQQQHMLSSSMLLLMLLLISLSHTFPTCNTFSIQSNNIQYNYQLSSRPILSLASTTWRRTRTTATSLTRTRIQRQTLLFIHKGTVEDAIISSSKTMNQNNGKSSHRSDTATRNVRQKSNDDNVNDIGNTTTTTTNINTNYYYNYIDIERQISIAGRQGRTNDAIQIFINHFVTQSVTPTIRHINTMIDACARGRPIQLYVAFYIINMYTTANILLPKKLNATIPIPSSSTKVLLERFTTKNNNNTTFVSPKNMQKLEPNVYTYGALMNAISRVGNIDMALYILDHMQASKVRPNVVVYQSAITAAANAIPPRPDIAIQLIQTAGQSKNNISINVIGYNAAITAAARANNSTLAIQILRQMQQAQLVSDSNDDNAIIRNKNIKVPAPDSVTYGTVMAACEHCNEWELVLQFANEIQQIQQTASASTTCTNSTTDGIYLDGMAITSALKACQQLGYASMALYYLDQMKLLMNTTSVSAISSNSRSLSPTAAATATYGRQRIGSKQPLLGPDSVAYRLAISACARGGAWKDGIRILDDYCTNVNDHDVIAYTAAITGCEYAGQWIEAVQLLIRMRQAANVQPNEVTFAAVIGACATACAKINDANSTSTTNMNMKILNDEIPLPQKKALQILNIMKNDPTIVNPNIQVYNAAIRVCAEAYDMKRAFKLYQSIQDDENKVQPNIITYGSLMLACERVGSVSGMDQVFTLMRKNHIVPNEIIYGTAISCCRKGGDNDRAYQLLEKMVRDGYQPNVATINTALIAQTEKSKSSSAVDLDKAIGIFKKYLIAPSNSTMAVEIPTAASLTGPSRQSYSIMIRAFVSNQRPKDAEALLRRMRVVDNMIPDVDLYTITVSAYERIGQPLNALRLMEAMREDGYDFYDVEVLNTLFKRLVKLVNAVGQSFGKNVVNTKCNSNNTTSFA